MHPYNYRHVISHTTNPYIHKCCGCIHLRIGSIIACVIWAGFSLYFAVVSFQGKSPFYSHIESIIIYIFGTINLIFFGISLVSIVPIYFRLPYPSRTVAHVLFASIGLLVIDIFINTIVFIVKKKSYVHWCIESTSVGLDNLLETNQIPIAKDNVTLFDTKMDDFYHCNRTWEAELKFSVMTTILISAIYTYWAVIVYSYSVKLKYRMTVMLQNRLASGMPMMGPI